MNTYASKIPENKSHGITKHLSEEQNSGETSSQLIDNRAPTIAQRKWQEIADNSPNVSQLKAYQNMADNYTGKQKPLADGGAANRAVQLMEIGRDLDPKKHDFFNSGNYKFATKESGRTPSYYFTDGSVWRRMRTQHNDGPELIRPRERLQFFFASKDDLKAMSDYVKLTGSPAGFKGKQLGGPEDGAYHGEFSPGSGTFHKSGGTIDLSSPPSDEDFAAIANALEQKKDKVKSDHSAIQL